MTGSFPGGMTAGHAHFYPENDAMRTAPVREPRATLRIETVPPSKNETKGWHWARYRAEKATWQLITLSKLKAARVPKGDHRCRVTYTVAWPKTGAKHRLPDGQNLQPWLDLCLADALKDYGFYPDDSGGRFRSETPVVEKADRAETVIEMEWEEA